jgi:hypothetical protein
LSRYLIPLLALSLASNALALSADKVCEEDEPELVQAQEELTEEILPCAVLDSDELGQHCAAAKVFIHTNTGVLLCSILLPPLELELSSTPWIDPVDHGTAGPGPSLMVGQVAAELSDPLPPLALTLERLAGSDDALQEGRPAPDPLPS